MLSIMLSVRFPMRSATLLWLDDLAGSLRSSVDELITRHDVEYRAESQQEIERRRLPAEEHPAQDRLGDQAPEVRRTAHDADRHFGKADPRIVGRDDEVTGGSQRETRAKCRAVNRGDDRNRAVVYRPECTTHLVHPLRRVLGVEAGELHQVIAATEVLTATG